MKTKPKPKLEQVHPEVEYTYRDSQERMRRHEQDRKRGEAVMIIVECAVVCALIAACLWLGNWLLK